MRIDVWSDLVCPWCFLAYRRLDKALNQLGGEFELEVAWRAYQLDPSAPPEPEPYGPMLAKKYGSGRAKAMAGQLEALGPIEGIDFRFDRVQRTNSRDAQQLLAWASKSYEPALVDRLHGRLFEAYFTEGAVLSDHLVLQALADEAGLDASMTARALERSLGGAQVDDDLAEAQRLEIRSVPTTLLGGRLPIPGAQDVDTFANLIRRAAKRFDSASD